MQRFKQLFTGAEPPHKAPPPMAPEPEPEAVTVRETTVGDVRIARTGVEPPLLLDVRERYEWRQVRIPGALHIPMNSIPGRLEELPKGQVIVVFCAHGNRSYGVAHFLCEQGFDAANLTGGITQWHIQGGEVEQGEER